MCTKYTLLQYNSLSEAIASGATEVSYGDKKVVYRSLEDMLRLQIEMERCLFPQNNANKNNGRRFVSFSKGTFRNRKC